MTNPEITWIIHYVPSGDDQTPLGFNCHTHGLEPYGGDLQIVLPLEPNTAAHLLNDWGLRMQRGELVIQEGTLYDNLVQGGYQVCFIPAMECGRRVWRAIVPDAANDLSRETSRNAIQYEVTGLQEDPRCS